MAINHISIVTKLRYLGKQSKKGGVERFFKTGEGQYAEGDVFLGNTTEQVRSLAKAMKSISHRELIRLLRRKEHEARKCALEIMCMQYREADAAKRLALITLYLDNTQYVNNWDLVDVSAHALLGEYLDEFQVQSKNGVRILTRDGGKLLRSLAYSDSMWERRIAIVSTFNFIRRKYFEPTFEIADILLNDKEDLIQKAVGWMLREVGKKDENALHVYLSKNATRMPRTTLRYAIERMGENMRMHYMRMKAE